MQCWRCLYKEWYTTVRADGRGCIVMMALGFDYNGRGFNLSCVNTSRIMVCRVRKAKYTGVIYSCLSSRHTCRFIYFMNVLSFYRGRYPYINWHSGIAGRRWPEAEGYIIMLNPLWVCQSRKKIRMVGNGLPITCCLINSHNVQWVSGYACVRLSFPVLPFHIQFFSEY